MSLVDVMAHNIVDSCIYLFSALIWPCLRRTIYRWIQGEIANAVMSGMSLSPAGVLTRVCSCDLLACTSSVFHSVFGTCRLVQHTSSVLRSRLEEEI